MMNTIKKIAKKCRDVLYMLEAVYISQWNQWRNSSFVCSSNTKRCTNNRESPYFRYEYFGKNTPVCCASHLFCILRDVVDVLENHNLEYFIFFGTLLGAQRHQGFIKWDTDVDIIIPHKDIEKTHRILQQELKSKYMIHDESDTSVAGGLLRVFLSEKNTLHVDLFAYIEQDEDVLLAYYRKFKKESLYPLHQVKLYDKLFWAPSHTEEHLKSIYGENCMSHAYKQFAFTQRLFELEDFSPAKVEC